MHHYVGGQNCFIISTKSDYQLTGNYQMKIINKTLPGDTLTYWPDGNRIQKNNTTLV